MSMGESFQEESPMHVPSGPDDSTPAKAVPDRLAEQRALLDAFDDPDRRKVAAAARKCGDLLRLGEWDAQLLEVLFRGLARLADHEYYGARQAVAVALPHVSDELCAQLQPKLLADNNDYVQRAAKDAAGSRAARKREMAQLEEHDDRLARWFARLGPGERRIAGWIAEHQTEFYVRREHHEIKNVCVAIDGALAELRFISGAEDVAARLRHHFGRMLRIHEDALKNARTVEPEYAPVRLSELLESQAEELPARYPERAARLDVDLTGVDRRVELVADASYLRQAFGNILRNAVEAYDARPGEPRIRVAVSARSTGTDAVIAFADEGAGMNEEQLQRVFVPFSSRKPGGTGFGLYNARKVARQIHGGELAIASTPGVGTTVTMTLPLLQEITTKKKRSTRSHRP
jgi:signal transduction histidine kinase